MVWPAHKHVAQGGDGGWPASVDQSFGDRGRQLEETGVKPRSRKKRRVDFDPGMMIAEMEIEIGHK
jgi:hypothetical protein